VAKEFFSRGTEAQGGPMSRSTVEAYICGGITIILAVLPMTWWLRGLGLLALIPFALDLIWHSPATHGAKTYQKAMLSGGSILVVMLIVAVIVPKEYAAERKVRTIATAPPQKAVVSLFSTETAYTVKQPGGGIAKVSLMIGRPVNMLSYFINDGPVIAEKANGWGKIFLAPDKSDATEISLAKQFDDYIATRHIPETGSTMEPHARTEHTITSLSDKLITRQDVINLTKDAPHVNEFMYLFLAETYVDEAGPHTLRYCKRLEPPAFMPETWVFCNKIQDRIEDVRLKGAS
jgi:hypothetical protein